MNYFVTAIDTDSGKTLVSSILCEALHAEYWKPVQAGLPRDADVVGNLVSNSNTVIHPEAYLLRIASSPHASAKADGITIDLKKFKLPRATRDLVIEGAGGVLVPLNDQDFVIDLIPLFHAEVILVADLYLGSINHTLLTLEALKKRNLSIRGIIFNGDSNAESEQIILKHTGLRCLLRVRREDVINRDVVIKYANLLKANWQ